jgi:hypothetical protein
MTKRVYLVGIDGPAVYRAATSPLQFSGSKGVLETMLVGAESEQGAIQAARKKIEQDPELLDYKVVYAEQWVPRVVCGEKKATDDDTDEEGEDEQEPLYSH